MSMCPGCHEDRPQVNFGFSKVLFLWVAASWQRFSGRGCKRCALKAIWTNAAKGLLTANVAWPLLVLPGALLSTVQIWLARPEGEPALGEKVADTRGGEKNLLFALLGMLATFGLVMLNATLLKEHRGPLMMIAGIAAFAGTLFICHQLGCYLRWKGYPYAFGFCLGFISIFGFLIAVMLSHQGRGRGPV